MKKQNCWEITGCGCEPGGAKTDEYGICSAAAHAGLGVEGPNGGDGAGRACWAAEDTICMQRLAKEHGSSHSAFTHCLSCAVFRQVCQEEGSRFELGLD